ncbi:MAG TPA: hypothetical protein VKE50_10135 [Thermoanaerobaculia bacterium]|nr:hypothetical protein [Thermoanaerobaculia bacterium]
MNRLASVWATVGLFAVLVLAVYSDPLFVRKNFGGRDLLGYNLPIEKAVHDAYARGRWPLWITEISGGRPLLANPNVGALYPLRALLALVPFPVAMRWLPVLHWLLAGAGIILLVRSLGGSPTASWLGAVTYVFSGVGVSEAYYTNHHPGVMLLPWIVWAATRIDWPWKRRTFVLSFLFGLDLLAGDVFTIGCALLAVLYLIVFQTPGPARKREAAALAASLGLAALLALPQLVASALWVPFTDRAVTGMTLNEALRLSLWPLRLVEWIVPYPFGESWRLDAYAGWGIAGRTAGFFPTLYAGAFACIALFTIFGSRSTGTRLARFCVLAGLAFAVPGSLLPDAWKSWRAPVALRHPEKLAVLVVFGLALFAAFGWDHLVAQGRVVRWPLAVGGALAVLALAARLFPSVAGRVAVWISGGEEVVFSIAARQVAPTLAEGGLLWMATVVAMAIATRRTDGSAILALALLTAVPIAADRKIGRTFRQEEVLAPTAFARKLMRSDPSGRFRTLALTTSLAPSRWGGQDVEGLEIWRRSWLYFTPALWNRGVVFNQDADWGDLSRIASLRRLATRAAEFSDAETFFQSFCLRWEIRSGDDPRRAGYRRIGGDALQEWDELEGASPDLRLVSRWREETSALAALNALPRLTPGEIVLETGNVRSLAAGGGSLRILEKSPELLRLETSAAAPTWLYVLRGYFPYRTIRIDRGTVEAVPAQLAFSAVPIPAGEHRIEWREDFPGGAISRWGPVLFLVTLAAGWRSPRRRLRDHA